ncbi:MAG TPA: Pls/PosA family non-ribosomal peptide synthetase [Pseudonocardiaceae bacterium]|jgi:non-ribosomal peptide synthetase-like protein|nr:Pls/PosA family non-ribosomal peptide synthetase [Pseudonocardiaceae bacterium]
MTATLLPFEQPTAEVHPDLVLVAEQAQGWRTHRDERLDHLFEERCDWIREYGRPGQLAVDSYDQRLTYDELDARTNQLARYLRLCGAGAGDRIALLFERPVDAYIGMLAVLKIGGAYVPLDVSSPAGRLAYIVADAQVRMVLTLSDVHERVEHVEALTAPGVELLFIDDAAPLIAELNECRLLPVERGNHKDQLAYIIYTSGSTDRPKGVVIDHPSICNFVRVAAEIYGIGPNDRVYQGLTIAFDLSVEEIWVPWATGATLVPKPPGASLLGHGLHEFLSERHVTAMCCGPTLLATIEDDLPNLRFLLVSGEACPQDLIARWHKPGRRLRNVYRPAEATVTATWTELHPTGTERNLATALAEPAPTPIENKLAEVLAEIVRIERVSVDSHFFDDLGADSMVMARFCARVRKQPDLPAVSMKDIYQHPTIKSLAAAFAGPVCTPVESSVPPSIDVETDAAGGGQDREEPIGTPRYVLCGALQLLFFLGYCYLAALLTARGSEWISAGSGLIDLYLRSVLFGAASFVGVCILPILAKWLLIGRWKPQQLRIWSLAYVRFWIVKTLVRSNPLVLFVGSPLYPLYLRALGAKVGRGVAIFSRTVPVATDLLAIGDGTVIRKDSSFTCYRAHAGLIETGAVTLGNDVFVGEATVLDIDTSLGDGAQLGHTSSLHAGQSVPDGEHWHGSPALRTEVDYRAVDRTDCGTLRRVVYTSLQLLTVLVLGLPLAVGGLGMLLAKVPQLTVLVGSGPLVFTSWTFYRDALAASFVLFFGSVLVGLLVVVTVPRVLSLAIKPDKIYRLYSFHYWVHRVIARMTNIKFFTYLFGDSSYIVHYLRRLGYGLYRVEQTGSNFGLDVKHETPYLSSVGSGTVVADGLSIINADFSSTSFRVSRTSIGSHNFLGNKITYPPQGKTGDNCLLATKAMVPLDGEVREGVGLLGSPSFEIPRSVERDNRFDHLRSGDELRRRLSAKNKHNVVTMGLYLLTRWIYLFGVTLLSLGAADLYASFGASVIALSYFLILLFSVVYFVLVERAVTVFQALSPQFCSIYEPYFWWHERYWKVPAMASLLQVFNGTPFKNAIWRQLGVRVGKRLFDDGATMTEKTLVTIGDDVTLNANSTIQCHSQEDYTFKSDHITIGAGCTLGVGAFVLYGATMGEGAVLAPDSFLMKGEEIPRCARWGGNPAREVRNDSAGLWRDNCDIRGTVAVGGE